MKSKMNSVRLPLFDARTAPDKQHPNFAACLHPSCEGPREVILDWSAGFSDRDGKFVEEFQQSFNSAFWELYLFACLKQSGHEVTFPKPSPDFAIRAGNAEVFIEAATASHSQGATPEHDIQKLFGGKDIPSTREFAEKAVARLSGALIEKRRKFNSHYKKLGNVGNSPFIVAIAPFDQPMTWAQNDLAIRLVLFGYDDSIYEDCPDGTRRIFGHKYRYEWTKANGSPIPLGLFVQGLLPEISGVVFSNTATFGKARCLSRRRPFGYVAHARYNPCGLHSRQLATRLTDYSEDLLDGLSLYLNPRAERPVPDWLFDHPRVSVQTIDTGSGLIADGTPDGFLINRSVQVFLGPAPDTKRLREEVNVTKLCLAQFLLERESATVSQIVQTLGMTAESIRWPLRTLQRLGVITSDRSGREVRYVWTQKPGSAT